MNATKRPLSMPVLGPTRSPGITTLHTGRRKSSRNLTPVSDQALRFSNRFEATKSSGSESCVLKDLLHHAHFGPNHSIFTCSDPSFGTFVCHVAIAGTRVHGHIYGRAGPCGFLDLDIDSNLFTGVSSSPNRNLLTTQALATLLLAYMESLFKENISRLEWLSSSAALPSSVQAAARVASAMELSKDLSITQQISSFLSPRFSKILEFDVVIRQDGFLKDMLPAPVTVKDKNIEVSKVPPPPKVENSEKRENLIHEIITTERTYVGRLQHLLKDYAIPLRAASRKQRGILGTYETNALFPTSLDAIVLLNQDLLKTLDATSGDFEFALSLNNAFKDFRKIYARYLETSSDLDQILRTAMKQPRFREFADHARSEASASIGIRELVMEPISRIPRYSLLISSLLAVITEANPAYQLLKDALITVRRIGLMERDHVETSQEIVMKLAALVSSWPTDLVKSSLRIVAHVDCLDVVPSHAQGSNANGTTQGYLCSLVLCSDRLIILKRARNVRLDEILQLNKKNELGYRGFIMLDNLSLFDGEDSLHLLCKTEVVGVSSERWTSRPYRRMALMTADAVKFVRQINTAKHESRQCLSERFVDTYQDMQVEYHVYHEENWGLEKEAKKSNFRICQDNVDSSSAYCTFVVTHDSESMSCVARTSLQTDMLCRNVSSIYILRDAIHERALALQHDSWLNPLACKKALFVDVHDMFLQSLVDGGPLLAGSSSKSRPTSPSKIMSSFLGRLGESSPTRPRTLATIGRTDTDLTVRSFSSHMISKKKSVPLFNFGNSDDRYLQGLEAFSDSLYSFERFLESDYAATSSIEAKQVTNLATMIAKDPKKGFAIAGSPSKVALHAFRLYCRTTLTKKLGLPILADNICLRLKSCHSMQTEPRQTKTREVLKDLSRTNLGFLRTILKVGRHLLYATVETARIQALLTLNEILVSAVIGNNFVSTLEILLADFDHYFQVAREMNMEGSINSGLSLPPGDSRFGSLSSVTRSQYTNDHGTLSTLPRSPAKQSAYSVTPDLIHVASSTDDTASLRESRRGSSDAQSLMSEPKYNYKRATIHVDQHVERYDFLDAGSAEYLPLEARSSQIRKGLPMLPIDARSIPRSLSEQFLASIDSGMTTSLNRTPTQASSILPEPAAPFVHDDLGSATGIVMNNATTLDHVSHNLSNRARRNITPSRIPTPSPRSNQSPKHTPNHSRDVSLSLPLAPLTSKKTTGIPRLPSTIVKRRESQGLTQSFSNHSFDFDSNLVADFTTAMHFSTAEVWEDKRDVTRRSISPSSESSGSEKFSKLGHRRASREQIRRDIADDSRMSSMATIRRVSKQLQSTPIGALNIQPATQEVLTLQRVVSKPADLELRDHEVRKNMACSVQCINQMESLRLELEHYKTIYRASAEEVDITLDLANEQIEQLQIAFEKGTVEATALSMLELEKEQNRKLMNELAELREKST